jgi:hypothetical protein
MKLRPTALRAWFAALGALLVMTLRVSVAQASDPAAARALFDQGRELVAAGDYPAACPKFEASLALDVGIGTKYNLADCWDQVGRTASAWALFLEVAADSRAAGQLDREAVAQQRARALQPKLSFVRIEVQNPAAGQEVLLDGSGIERGAWDNELPLDPGEHTVSAQAPGRETFTTTLRVDISSRQSVTVPSLAKTATPQPEPGQERSHLPLILAASATGVFAAGTVVTGLVYESRQDDYDQANESRAPTRADDRASAETMGTLNLVCAGATAVGAAVTLFFWLSDSEEPPAAGTLDVGLVLDPQFSQVTVRGVLP